MTTQAENPNQHEASEHSPVQRFDILVSELTPFFEAGSVIEGHDLEMGNHQTPILPVGKDDLQFLVFLPDPSHHQYSPSIVFHKLEFIKRGNLGFMGPKSTLRLRRNQLVASDLEDLDDMEDALSEYKEIALGLPPREAKAVGFSIEFANRQSRIRRAGLSVAKSLRLVGN